MTKTHKTAMVLIPPKDVWAPIQAIRTSHDKQVRRWMPHITLLYPFAPKGNFTAVLPEVAQVAWAHAPFDVSLSSFRYFKHGNERFTVWLEPTPTARIVALHRALLEALPQFQDTDSFRGGFSPHLSVGQVEGGSNLKRLVSGLQSDWQPLSFTLGEVALISRKDPPNDIFQIDHTVLLGD